MYVAGKCDMSCMVSCRLIKAPMELERTQDMHNGQREQRSVSCTRGAASITLHAPLFYGPRKSAAHARTPKRGTVPLPLEAVRPLKRAPPR